MTSTESGSGSYGPAPRRSLPGWVWGVGACACLPILAVFALGLIAGPGLKRAGEAMREVGRTRTCLSNVKQIATGLQMYAQDYDEHLPPASGWMDTTKAFTAKGSTKEKDVFRCPAAALKVPDAYGYAYSTALAGKPLGKVGKPADAPMVYDSTNLTRSASDAVTTLPSPGRHHGRRGRPGGLGLGGPANNVIGYADGHAKTVSDGTKPDAQSAGD